MGSALLRARVAAALLLCVSCAGKAHETSADAGATANGGACGTVRIPKGHRALAQACPTERGSDEPIDMSGCMNRAGITCTKDADCTDGKNGRCIPHNEPCDTACSYDECLTDSDCALGPCLCRTNGADITQNKCLGGTCKTDADCGCGYCSLSAVPIGHGCHVEYPTYTCHTASDECTDPSDCADGIVTYCAYGASGAEHWACGSCVPFPVP